MLISLVLCFDQFGCKINFELLILCSNDQHDLVMFKLVVGMIQNNLKTRCCRVQEPWSSLATLSAMFFSLFRLCRLCILYFDQFIHLSHGDSK
jgi:hypothetical protein